MEKKYTRDKGVAGLTILLSLVVMLFVIGLLIMIFAIMSAKLQDSTYDSVTTASANETLAVPTTAGISLATGAGALHGSCGTITQILNGSSGALAINSGNYTQTGCTVTNKTSWAIYSATVRYSYPYTYDSVNTATNAINDTSHSISTATDWFDIFIVIGAMVVLILLTVIIITAIRSSGLVASEAGRGTAKVGTA